MIRTLLLAVLALADEFSHVYQPGEAVTVWLNKAVSKLHPLKSHTVNWLSLCRGQWFSTHPLSVGEVLEGFELQDSGMEVNFLQNLEQRPLCSVQLSKEVVEKLEVAVQKEFWVQLIIDDLAVWGSMGVKDNFTLKESVYTHFHLLIHYQNNQIIHVVYKPEGPAELGSAQQALNLTYSVTWVPSATPFQSRLSLYEDYFFSYYEYVCFFVIALYFWFLSLVYIGLFSVQLVRNKLLNLRLAKTLTDEGDLVAFREMAMDVKIAPKYLLLFTVLVSAGTQLLAVALSMILLFILFPVYLERNHRLSLLVTLYSVFALLGSLRNASVYSHYRGAYWKTAQIVSFLGIPTLVAIVALILQAYSPALPLISEAEGKVLLIVGAPMHLIGAVFGRNYYSNPILCDISVVEQRVIPSKRWHEEESLGIIIISGFLPLSVLAVPFSFLFLSVYEYKLFCLHGLSLLLGLEHLLIIASIAICGAYSMICSRDYRWPWVSFLGAGLTAGYLFVIAMIFYAKKSQMSGWLSGALFFGYIGLAFFCLFLVFGAVGFSAADLFMRYVYTYIKRQ